MNVETSIQSVLTVASPPGKLMSIIICSRAIILTIVLYHISTKPPPFL